MEHLRKDARYTYADYLAWGDEVRYELIDGVPYMLAAPSPVHQEVSFELCRQLGNFLVGRTCRAYAAPFDVRLRALEGDDTVVQPDISIVCDRGRIDERGCIGAPDMIIEILSPSTTARDTVLKFNTYLQAGVREYWVVEPEREIVSAHVLKGGQYVTMVYGDADIAPVHVLEGCTIDLSAVFVK